MTVATNKLGHTLSPSPVASIPENLWSLLAGLRFLLATVVVFGHMTYIFPAGTTVGVNWIGDFGSFQAVAGFFFISGLSIANSVAKDKTCYFLRRFLRIAPIYVVCFFLSVLPWHYFGPVITLPGHRIVPEPQGQWGRISIILNGLCLQGWVTGTISTFIPSWSLSCEVFYYAIAPLLAKLNDRRLLLLGGASFAYFVYHMNFERTQFMDEQHGIQIAMLFFLWLGGFLYYRHWNNDKVNIWLPYALVFAGTVDWNQSSPHSTLLMLALGLVIARANHIKLSDKARKWLNVAGGVSYPLYLIHFIMLIVGAPFVQNMSPYAGCYYYFVCVAGAALLYFTIDVPITSFSKRKLKSSRALPV
jgi:peptidoglycan/LPS O-acetylase OafA/YrhL